VSDELKRVRKLSWPNSKVLFRHSPGGTEENNETSHDSWSS
jgi:hypothetical protein